MSAPLTPRPLRLRIEDAVVDTAGYVVLQVVPIPVIVQAIRLEGRRRRWVRARRAAG